MRSALQPLFGRLVVALTSVLCIGLLGGLGAGLGAGLLNGLQVGLVVWLCAELLGLLRLELLGWLLGGLKVGLVIALTSLLALQEQLSDNGTCAIIRQLLLEGLPEPPLTRPASINPTEAGRLPRGARLLTPPSAGPGLGPVGFTMPDLHATQRRPTKGLAAAPRPQADAPKISIGLLIRVFQPKSPSVADGELNVDGAIAEPALRECRRLRP